MLKRLAGPARHYFNSRFSAIHQSVVQGNQDEHRSLLATLDGIGGVADRLDDVKQNVITAADHVDESVHQSLSLLGRSLDDLSGKVDLLLQLRSTTCDGAQGGGAETGAPSQRVFDAQAQGALSELGEYEAAVANFAHAHDSWSAQAGLWFNPPLLVSHAAGGVSLVHVNERIAEIPFVFRALAGLPAGCRVLDIGSTESTVPLSLATLGYDVTSVDPRPYPLSHPNLTSFQGFVEDFTSDRPFDAVILLSSIEHFGVGAYELPVHEDADLVAMARLRELARPGARLAMTAPYGNPASSDFERTYGPERLGQLLEGWDVDEQSYLARESLTEWRWQPSVEQMDRNHVVLVSARRSE